MVVGGSCLRVAMQLWLGSMLFKHSIRLVVGAVAVAVVGAVAVAFTIAYEYESLSVRWLAVFGARAHFLAF